MQDPLADYPVVTTIPVAWGEQDAFGHVNNIYYFRWCESARIEYGERIGLLGMHRDRNIGPVIAQIGCNFRQPVVHPDTVRVGARVSRLGRTSLTMEHLIVSEKLGVVADASSVLVLYDYGSSQPYEIPEAMRRAVNQLQKPA
ncbi:MAG TPA: acyl-CoA thioesterase [Solibacterales bacterium]|nr:acyl-CoA thioesterase [Bryobacterales bacterium]